LDAPAETSITLHWDEQEPDGIAFTHPSTAEAHESDVWLAELPPRPNYHLTIAFASPMKQAILKELVLVNVRQLDRPVLQLSGDELRERCVPRGVEAIPMQDGLVLNGPAGGSLSLPASLIAVPRRAWKSFARVWLLLASALMMLVLVGLSLVRDARAAMTLPEHGGAEKKRRHGMAALWMAFGLGLAFHLANTASVPAQYNPCDPLAYFHKAVWLAEKGVYETQTPFWELDRLPGYPLFLAACLKLFGYQLKLIALTQGFLFGTALLALALSLRRWVSPWLGGVGLLVLLVDPAGLQHSRGIGTESLFSTLSALSLAAFFEHVGTRGSKSALWLAVHALAATAAVFVRPNGIILLAAPLSAYVPALARAAWRKGGLAAKLPAMAAVTLRYSLPAVLMFLALGAWSYRNYRQHGLLAPTSMVGVSLVEGLMQSGTFEARCLAEDSLYEEYLVCKRIQGNAYCGWDLRSAVHAQMAAQGTGEAIPALDQRLKSVAARSRQLSPWQLRCGGLLRSSYWAIRLPARLSYSRNLMWLLFPCAVNSEDATAHWKEFCTKEAVVGCGKVLPLTDLDNQEPTTQWAPAFLRQATPWHGPAYWIFLLGGLAGFLAAHWKSGTMLAVPGLVYLANMALNIWLLNIQGRYLLTLEFALVFQTILGLQFLIRYACGWLQAAQRRPVSSESVTVIEGGCKAA
jgi:hypothetical protein